MRNNEKAPLRNVTNAFEGNLSREKLAHTKSQQ